MTRINRATAPSTVNVTMFDLRWKLGSMTVLSFALNDEHLLFYHVLLPKSKIVTSITFVWRNNRLSYNDMFTLS